MRLAMFAVLLALPVFAESAAGLKWTAPAGWKNEGSRPMRAATYDIAPAPGDTDAPECAVYFFGPGQGGSVQANIDRWKTQMVAGGKPADAKIEKKTVHGLPVTTIESAGEYAGMGGPMQKSPTTKSGYRLLGAIIEGPGGNIFIKFTGPAKTIAANQSKFTQLVNSFEKD
jgi:hypothetical protein